MRRRSLLLIALLATLLCLGQASTERGTVVHVVDGDTLKVSTPMGTVTVRLIGIDTPELGRADRTAEFFAQEARTFASGLTDGKTVRLETDQEGDTRDDYGRALRYVYLPDGRMLNALLISEGYAHAYTSFPFSRRDEFRALEREAREAGKGLWGAQALPTLTPEEAADHVGSTGKVCGTVASTKYANRTRGKPTFLNLGKPYPNQPMTVVIWGTARPRFDAPETTYANKRVCVTGTIRLHRGKPEIVIDEPAQIEIVPAP